MESAWGNNGNTNKEAKSLAEIMSEEYAHRIQTDEIKRYEKKKNIEKQQSPSITFAGKLLQSDTKDVKNVNDNEDEWEDYSALLYDVENITAPSTFKVIESATVVNNTDVSMTVANADEWEDCSALLYNNDDTPGPSHTKVTLLSTEKSDDSVTGCDSDEVIAKMLQSQYDREYNEEVRRIERHQNKQSKVNVILDNLLRGDESARNIHESDEEHDEDECERRDWDRFETNEKIFENIPKCGFKMDKEGEMITKHDERLCGVRNACRVMSFPPDFPTGDGAGFDMKLNNQVFNKLKKHSRRVSGSTKKNTAQVRRKNYETAEMGVDERTRILLYKLINNQVLEQINGIISTGKEAVILHANSDPNSLSGNESSGVHLPPHLMPSECAVKIFKTTLNEFKQRDRYIKDDFRLKGRFSKLNRRVGIGLWAEKEMLNLKRMQKVGLKCPDVVILKQHVLVMSFIGSNHNAAPKLKDAQLSLIELREAYNEIINAMYTLYNEAKLVHADLSEYNILWFENKCWFIDVAQAVEPEHPSAFEFLMRDCANIIGFFNKRGLPNIYTKEKLFEYITSLNAETHNVAMLERIHTRGPSVKQATAPNQADCPDELKPLDYPFDLAWEKSQLDREQERQTVECELANSINVNCSVAAALKQEKDKIDAVIVAPIIVAVANTAEN